MPKGKLITLEGIDGTGKSRIEEIKRKVSMIVELLKFNQLNSQFQTIKDDKRIDNCGR